MISVSAEEAYGLWAPTYDSQSNPLLALEDRAVAPILASIQPRHAVDVGCGTGRWSERLMASGCQLAGVDASLQMLLEAEQKPGLLGNLAVGRDNALPLRTGWADLVLCSLSLGYFVDIGAVFQEFARVASPGASIVVSDLHPEREAAGWTRSFRSSGVAYQIRSSWHSLSSMRSAAKRSGLVLQELHEMCFGINELSFFEATGKSHLFEELRRQPALFVALWQKQC